MIEPFDPYHLTPSASLNRLRIVDLPGLMLGPAVKGKAGYELVSARALSTMILEHADSLKLPDTQTKNDRELPILLDACFDSDDPQVRDTAQSIKTQFARNLYYLLLTLQRGDEISRQARTDWDDSYWDHWRDIQHIWLGGGLVSGHLGRQVVDELRHDFQTGYTVSLDPHGDALPIIGAARCIPFGHDSTLVFDFGGSFVKRARAVYKNGTLTELHRLPSIPTPSLTEDQPQLLFDFFVSTIVDTWKQTGGTLAPFIPVSLAAYVRDGQPLERQGGLYASLRHVADTAQHALSEAVSERIGMAIKVLLLHDGTSAALTYAGSLQTAVIMIGTAMGVGFPPTVDDLRPKAEQIKIRR
jgi:hypothetical protein